MTVIVVLAGLLISHFLTAVGQWRNFDWLLWPVRRLRRRFPEQAWLPMASVMVVSLAISVAAIWVVTALAGIVGWMALGLVVFVYTLGPRDLDRDVAVLLERDAPEDPSQPPEAARAMRLHLDEEGKEAAAAVFHGGLSRWFGIIFWFVVLGVAGAVLYRTTRKALQMDELDREHLEWLSRLRIVLDLPVLFLMVVSMALCGDLDRVYRVWRDSRGEMPAWMITPAILDRVAAVIAPAPAGFDEGLVVGHRMVWRVLVLWLVVMSLLLLAGWLA